MTIIPFSKLFTWLAVTMAFSLSVTPHSTAFLLISSTSIKAPQLPRRSASARQTDVPTIDTRPFSWKKVTFLSSSNNNMDDIDLDDAILSLTSEEIETIKVVQEEGSDKISDDLWEDIEGARPPLAMVMKELLGINVFTYILAVLIVISLSLNALLGPGWLGQLMGLPGVGTFTEQSASLPTVVDLNGPENLL